MARHTAKAIHSGSPQSSSVRHTEYAMSRTTYGGAGARSRHTAAAMSRAGRPLAASPGGTATVPAAEPDGPAVYPLMARGKRYPSKRRISAAFKEIHRKPPRGPGQNPAQEGEVGGAQAGHCDRPQ
jgi:hypothetical protein